MEKKYCSNCGSEIDLKAEICTKCGVRVTVQQKNPGLAAVLSALFVGVGQIYNGQIAKGLLFILAYIVSWCLMLLIIGFITTPIIWIIGIYDAYNSAKQINAGLINV